MASYSSFLLHSAIIGPSIAQLHHQHPLTTTSTPTTIKIKIKTQTTHFYIKSSSSSSSSNVDGESYLDMWKRANQRKIKGNEFLNIPQKSDDNFSNSNSDFNPEGLDKKKNEFQKILEVSREERDRIQRLQIIDRAAAAIAAARSLLKETPPPRRPQNASGSTVSGSTGTEIDVIPSPKSQPGGEENGDSYSSKSRNSGNGTPGPDFWSWTPPENDSSQSGNINLQNILKASASLNPSKDVIEMERSEDVLEMPFESKLSESCLVHSLPPFQSFTEVHKGETSNTTADSLALEKDIDVQFSVHAEEAAHALNSVEGSPAHGIYPNGTRWWKETGTEIRADGVVVRWTLNRGVTADGVVEWEDKYWEAADEFEYKELGSEKSGRDAMGNVWHEYWKEAMWQEHGLVHMEKTADKWGKNGKGEEWQEKWFEHYDSSAKAEKWAHKWCSVDPNTQLDAGHAHVWHERWGENYDGLGGSTKYTDKWAERCEGDVWVKWGDKWDEHFNQYAHGVKQGETWWEGAHGERWNRTWGEQHNGSGWVHKYGKSSSGEHWDTHAQEDTWYERHPHFGFMHCLENSVQLREVQKPSEKSS